MLKRWNFLKTGFYEGIKLRPEAAVPSEAAAKIVVDAVDPAERARLPDVYYVILDGYGDSRTLRDSLDYDNHELIDYLKFKGFYVPTKSLANYSFTMPSLASSLNMQYVDYLAAAEGGATIGTTWYFNKIRGNEVSRFLRTKGYQIMHLWDRWKPQDGEHEITFVGCDTVNKTRFVDDDFLHLMIDSTRLRQ